MTTVENIKKIISALPTPEEGFNFIEISSYLWGKNSEGQISFGFVSKNINILPLQQITKHLKLYINHVFKVTIDGLEKERKLSLLVLREKDGKRNDTFIRIALAMLDDLNEEKMLKHFFDLKDLFSNDKNISNIKLEGIFGELFTMYVLKKDYNIDISTYYQKEDKRKFDFNLTDKRKIEVKTTLKPERIHHFLHQQLDKDRYDIRVVSIMLQKDDSGMSLLKLINECKELFSAYFNIVVQLELLTKNIDDHELEEMKFNFRYAKDNFKIFDAIKMPSLTERDIEGVFNVEYDIDLSNVQSEAFPKFIHWILNNN